MKRIGFVLSHTDGSWLGGINYLSNLLHAIACIPGRQIEPVLIVPPETQADFLARFPPWSVERTVLARSGNRGWGLARKLAERGLGLDFMLQGFLRSKSIDLLSHSDQLGARSRLPSICWLPDFQHLRMPEFFKQAEVDARNRGYRRLAENCSTVLLSSYDAQRDLAGFAPAALPTSRVLHFVPGFATAKQAEVAEDMLRQKYQIQGTFFLLPNQFWAHKNHKLVIEALALLKGRGQQAVVLCTGHTQDRRQPEYFGQLMQQVQQLGVEDNFRVLGLVPYEDLAALMHAALAVINPSLFEGWSTSVEEAKSLGLQVLLSDIPVHREQAPERGHYIDPRNPEPLAQALWQTLSSYSIATELKHRAAAEKNLVERFSNFGAQFQAISLETIARAS